MTKKLITIGMLAGTFLISGCGGSSDSSDKNTTSKPSTQSEPESNACTVSGKTVLVDEGTTCTNGEDTLKCEGNIVTLNGSISSKTITINGKTYTCQ